MIRLGICKVLNMTNSQATLESCKLTAEAKPSATVTGPYMPPFGIAVSRVMGKHDVLTILQKYSRAGGKLKVIGRASPAVHHSLE
jgi:hypothetical protein